MLAKRIVPCLDVKDGQVVKGINFEGLRYAGDPVRLARYYSDQGADELVFLDITATKDRRRTTIPLVRRVAQDISIPFTVGGGIGDVETISEIISSGADKVSVNTAAFLDPTLITKGADEFGSQAIVVAIDARSSGPGYEVVIEAGTKRTGVPVEVWASKAASMGAGEILLTSMDKDGTRDGFDIELLKRVTGSVNIPVIASGGAGIPSTFLDALDLGGADAVLAASVFHYGMVPIPLLKKYLMGNGIGVRI